MPGFQETVLTDRGEDLRAKCEGASATLEFTRVSIGKGGLPAGGDLFSATRVTATVTITNQQNGNVTNAADFDTGFAISVTQQGTSSLPEISQVICNAASTLSGGEYFKIDFPLLGFYVYFTVDGIGDDPMPAGRIPILVAVLSTDTAAEVAEKTKAVLDGLTIDFTDMVRLANEVMDIDIVSVTFVGDGTTKLSCAFNNSEVATPWEWREIGIWATDPDLGEILYAYTNTGDNFDIIPVYGGATLAEYDLDIYTKIGTVPDVSAILVPPSGLVTLDAFNDHIQDKQAHGNAWLYIDADHTAEKGQKLLIDTIDDEIEVTLPTDAAKDDWVEFQDYSKTFPVNNLIIKQAASGEKIEGYDEDLKVTIKGISFGLVYTDEEVSGEIRGWAII